MGSPILAGRTAGTGGELQSIRDSTANSLWLPGHRETCTDVSVAACMPQTGRRAHQCGRGLGAAGQTPGGDWGWWHRNRLKGMDLVWAQLRGYKEEAWPALETKNHCLGGERGEGKTCHRLSPCVLWCPRKLWRQAWVAAADVRSRHKLLVQPPGLQAWSGAPVTSLLGSRGTHKRPPPPRTAEAGSSCCTNTPPIRGIMACTLGGRASWGLRQ